MAGRLVGPVGSIHDMKLTINIPIDLVDLPGDFQFGDAMRAMATSIERAGIDACFVTDHPAPSVEWLASSEGHDALDPLTALAFVAAATSRLMVHTNVIVLPYRNPFILSKAAMTLQQLSGGRLILGVAAGFVRDEFAAVGADPARRGALTDEALETLRLIWSGEPVTKRGQTFSAVNIMARANPSLSPPIWVGGSGDKAVERAARWGDGWSPFWSRRNGSSSLYAQAALTGVEELRGKIARLHELRAQLGRTGSFDVALAPPHQLKPGERDEAELYLESIAAMAELGVTWTMLRVKPASVSAYLEIAQWLGEEVVPHLPGRDASAGHAVGALPPCR